MKHFLLTQFLFLCILLNISAQQNGIVTGNVTDISTGQSLPGASIFIEGKTIGTSTDIDGNYRLMNIPVGSYTIVFQFIGYVPMKQQIEILAGTTSKLDAALTADAFGLDEVVVTAQMLGQAKAINQQLNSDAMVNVVSSDKIKELPDINAAEAIGRLPGISLIRSGGEASKVVLRGLNPSLTSVTINGVRVPSSGANDRSVDLSMISPDLLSNIEVFKSATADMDGDAIGGIVNLGVIKASPNPQANFRLYGGYNGLKNEIGKNYKVTADVSRRFFNQKLGILAKANYEQINRSFESVGMTYDIDDTTQFLVDNLSLTNNAPVSLIERLLELGRPILVSGGGGYHVENTVRGWALAWQAIAGEHQDFELGMGGVMLGNREQPQAVGGATKHPPIAEHHTNARRAGKPVRRDRCGRHRWPMDRAPAGHRPGNGNDGCRGSGAGQSASNRWGAGSCDERRPPSC